MCFIIKFFYVFLKNKELNFLMFDVVFVILIDSFDFNLLDFRIYVFRDNCECLQYIKYCVNIYRYVVVNKIIKNFLFQ